MSNERTWRAILTVVGVATISAALPHRGGVTSVTKPKQGQGGSVVQGGAGTAGARAIKVWNTARSRWARWPSTKFRTRC